jgi:hypothetical protein
MMKSSSDTIQKLKNLTYLIFGNETGTQGTPHLQGYLEVSKKLSLTTLKRILPRSHFEIARGSSQEASEYCKKENDFEEAGVLMKGQGYRSDLESIQEAIKDGKDELWLAENHFRQWVQYRRSFAAYINLLQKPRDFKTKVEILWGKTRTGKTRYCYEKAKDKTYWSPGDFKWFDNYIGQEVVIIDDYRGEYPLPLVLKLLDRYPMQVPVKGGFTNWRPRFVYITSNTDPYTWYQDHDQESQDAFIARIEKIKKIDEPILFLE